MRIVEPKITILPSQTVLDNDYAIKFLETVARVPYKSESYIKEGSAGPFIRDKIVATGHHAMIEFQDLTFAVTTDRGVTHELVRHRMASFAQESTRYCNYTKEHKFEGGIAFVRPFFFREGTKELNTWMEAMAEIEYYYNTLIKDLGCSPQQARAVLPNSTKATIVMKMNFRELLHFFEIRCKPDAHPQMRQIAIPLAMFCRSRWPEVFGIMDASWFADLPALPDPENPRKLSISDLAKIEILTDLSAGIRD